MDSEENRLNTINGHRRLESFQFTPHIEGNYTAKIEITPPNRYANHVFDRIQIPIEVISNEEIINNPTQKNLNDYKLLSNDESVKLVSSYSLSGSKILLVSYPSNTLAITITIISIIMGLIGISGFKIIKNRR